MSYCLKLDVIGEGGVCGQNGERVTPKHLTRLLAEAQTAALDDTLCGKTINGVFFKQVKQEGWDTSASHAWFLDGRLRGETEGLIVAAQDGVIHTRDYQFRILKKSVSPLCRFGNRWVIYCLAVLLSIGLYTRKDTTGCCTKLYWHSVESTISESQSG